MQGKDASYLSDNNARNSVLTYVFLNILDIKEQTCDYLKKMKVSRDVI